MIDDEEPHNWQMRVLVVEDDAAVAAGIIDGLSHAAFETLLVATGAACLASLGEFTPDLVLLDLGLPDMDGTDVCKAIRSETQTPIIVVSARGDEIDRVLALEMGADDFVVKPFGMRELIARIRAVSRRTRAPDPAATETLASATATDHGQSHEPMVVRRFGPLVVDARAQRVMVDDVEVYLTPKEFDLLLYLSEDPGAVFRRSEILHDVWDTNWYGTTKTLDTHIATIRKKLGNPAWIESVRGVGFRFGRPL